MILPGRAIGGWRLASSSARASPASLGCLSGLRPCRMYSSRLPPPSGWIPPSSICPTLGAPPPVEYVTSFNASPLPIPRDYHETGGPHLSNDGLYTPTRTPQGCRRSRLHEPPEQR